MEPSVAKLHPSSCNTDGVHLLQERRQFPPMGRGELWGAETNTTPRLPSYTFTFISLNYFEMGFCFWDPEEFKLVIIWPKITSCP